MTQHFVSDFSCGFSLSFLKAVPFSKLKSSSITYISHHAFSVKRENNFFLNVEYEIENFISAIRDPEADLLLPPSRMTD